MSNSVITMRGLSKSYKKAEALHDFSLNVQQGHICGLIGPNGAGKTTIMKILAGLIFQTSGELEYFGKADDLDKSRSRMSFMIEAPIVDPKMTAYDNLAYLRYVRGYPDEKRIDEALDIVGLSDTGKKKCEKFSLGMRQRLGIAMALLPKPEVLVLDEPVNGLDPEGIFEVRQLLKKLTNEQIVFEELNLSNMLTDMLMEQYGWLNDSGIEPEFGLEDGVMINSDRKYVTRILQNLISNSEKYALSRFGVRLKKTGATVTLSVFNDAEDSSSIDTARVFEPFYKADSRSRKGTGLGLYVVKNLAEKLGWTVSARFSEDGLFTVELTMK